MNGIGIDYQATVTILALREGPDGRRRTRLVDDGHRTVIPHAADNLGAWGTAAYMARPASSCNSSQTGPWLGGEETDAYWRELRERLFRYLGQLPPNPRGGYEVTIAVPDTEGSVNAMEVLGHSERAGFTGSRVVSSTDALLCRWLSMSPSAREAPASVSVVAVGDRAICAAGYSLDDHSNSDGRPRFTRGAMTRIDGLGFSCWCDHLMAEVRRHLNEPPGAGEELLLVDGAIEFAARLGRAGPDDVLEWTGPLHEECFEPPTFTARECRRWPDVVRLAVELREALRRVMPPEGTAPRGELIVVGGLGAVWPFAADVAREMGHLWISPTPEQDVALGAAWWPVFGPQIAARPTLGLTRTAGTAAPGRPEAAEEGRSAEDRRPSRDPTPPWLRDQIRTEDD